MKNVFVATFLAIILALPIFYIVQQKAQPVDSSNSTMPMVEFGNVGSRTSPGLTFEIEAAKVLDGYRFDVLLKNRQHVRVHLTSATQSGATAKVVQWLKEASPPAPSITLLRDTGEYWIVDFHLTREGKRTNLVTLLDENGLLL